MKTLVKIFCLLLPFGLMGQSYTDYLGAGHDVGITITASSSNAKSPAENTLSGSGMDSPTFAAGRFLSHATMGPTQELVAELLSMDNNFGAWIDDQFDTTYLETHPIMDDIWDEIVAFKVSQGENPDNIFGPWWINFEYAWHQAIMTDDNQLRHKIAHALSQILVVSRNSDIGDWGEGMADYYDILLEHSFGNYRDLLEDVTYSFQMGYYLSHLNNAKANEEANTSPDENYAREIMQLFSIGLYELNIDGTKELDSNENPIATYGQNDIQEFAKIFTGLGIGTLAYPDNWPYEPFFGLDTWAAKKDEPMVMYADFHETTEKTLLGGEVLPANQTGEQDISDALDNLFNHSNVGPFISNLMIKRLVKSNPSPDYIERVATTFNDNGSGVRGDMKAVVKAILMDPEARGGEAMLDQSASRAKEPIQKFLAFVRAMPLIVTENRFWNITFAYADATGQGLMNSPTVFNFYPPNFQPIGDFAELELTAPELKLHNTTSAFNATNYMYTITQWDNYYDPGKIDIFSHWENTQDLTPFPYTQYDLNYFLQYADDPELLINELDKRLTYGQLTDETRDIIIPALHDMYDIWGDWWLMARVKNALYLILISPDYNIMR
ncbi:MAG: hypothetical protein ACJATI_003787 [Halioglobus sp.]|jgi:uncharacterized protein (DUF1800 family)